MKRVIFAAMLLVLCPAMALAATMVGNTGETIDYEFTGHVLTATPDSDADYILYMPTEADDAAYRASVAALTGATVDYFDPRAAVPDVATLEMYDAVMTWVNFPYLDPVATGDNLAAYVDGGGKVILGQWVHPTAMNYLDGAIMTTAYCPTTASDYSSGDYIGDGTDCVWDGVTTISSSYVDIATLATGTSDGTMSHGGVAAAWREDRMVYNAPGNTGSLFTDGETDVQLANMVDCASGPLLPTVTITCNGSGGPVTVVKPDPITLDIDVEARDYAGKPIDLWALLTNITDGEGWAAYDGSWNFPVTPPFAGHALVSGPLDDWSKTILDVDFPLPGTYTAYLVIDPIENNSYNATAHNIMDSVDFTVLPAGTKTVLIWSPAGSVSGDVMANLMGKMGLGYELETGDLPADLGAYAAVFVDLGIFSNNHVLTDAEGDVIAAYLDAGGNVYMEGGDTWYYDTPTAAHPYFGITGLSDGSADTFNCDGIPGTFTHGMSFPYVGENNWMDHLEPVEPAYAIFAEPTALYINGVAHDAGTYKTIGTSFEFGGLVDEDGESTKLVLLGQYLDFFGLTE